MYSINIIDKTTALDISSFNIKGLKILRINSGLREPEPKVLKSFELVQVSTNLNLRS